MKTCPKRFAYDHILKSLKDNSKSIQDACKLLNSCKKRQKLVERLKHPLRTLKNIIKRAIK